MPVIFHILLHLDGLILGDALGALFAAEETLKDVIRSLRGRTGRLGFKELFTQGSPAEAIDGLHLLKQDLSLFEKAVEIGFHEDIVSY